MIMKGLSKVFRFYAEIQNERRERHRDFLKEARQLDQFDNDHLAESMDGDAYIKLEDVLYILRRLSAAQEYRFSSYDRQEFISPVLGALQQGIMSGEINCHIGLDEDLIEGCRVRAGDLLDILDRFELPDGAANNPKASENVDVPVDAEFDDSALGRLRHKFSRTFPLRTPSVEVREERQETEQPLNIRRPLILAIGLAVLHREQSNAIEAEGIPTYKDTRQERKAREQKRKQARYYRGTRID